jgi:hypothetical protein
VESGYRREICLRGDNTCAPPDVAYRAQNSGQQFAVMLTSGGGARIHMHPGARQTATLFCPEASQRRPNTLSTNVASGKGKA